MIFTDNFMQNISLATQIYQVMMTLKEGDTRILITADIHIIKSIYFLDQVYSIQFDKPWSHLSLIE